MGTQTKKLSEILGLGTHELVSITGGGGKTALAFLLADELVCAGEKTLITSTTHLQYPQDFDGAIVVSDRIDCVVHAAHTQGAAKVFAVTEDEANGKMKGFANGEVNNLFEVLPDFTLLNEADGAARKPYKFYRNYEPVIPSATTVLVHVIGCEVYGAAMNSLLFHRCPDNLVGQVCDESVLHRELAWFVQHKLATFTGRKILVVNKADQGRHERAERLCKIGQAYFDQCVVSSLHERIWWMP